MQVKAGTDDGETNLPRLLRETSAALDSSARYADDLAGLLDDPLRSELLALTPELRQLSHRLVELAESLER